jgi:hypothetical protein
MLEAAHWTGKLIDSHLPYPDRYDAAPGQGGTLDAGKYGAAFRQPRGFSACILPVGRQLVRRLQICSGRARETGSACPDATFEIAFRHKLVPMH